MDTNNPEVETNNETNNDGQNNNNEQNNEELNNSFNHSRTNLLLNGWFFIVDLISLIILSILFYNYEESNKNISTNETSSNEFTNWKYWGIATFVYHSISFLSVVHNLLKKKFAFLIIQRRVLRFIDILIFILNHILAWVVVIWGFILWDKVDDNNLILIYFLKTFTIYHTIIFSCFWLLMSLICCFYLCCYPVNPGDEENQTPASKNMITENSLIKTITEKFGLGDQCSICLENYDEGEEIRTLKCGHFYHKTCIDTWLERSQLCPYCRQKIDKGTDLKENATSLSNT